MADSPRRGRARRAGGLLVALLVSTIGVVGLLAFFNSRDAAEVSSPAPAGPGQALPDQGARHLARGQAPRVRYASRPPTSGPHVPTAVRGQEAAISDDQLLHAVELGNVVLLYGSAAPPAGLRELAEEATGPFDPALAQGGQAVILARRSGTEGVVAVAWRHLLRARSGEDPRLRGFVDHWLGRGRSG